jgi:hypothetical protein
MQISDQTVLPSSEQPSDHLPLVSRFVDDLNPPEPVAWA